MRRLLLVAALATGLIHLEPPDGAETALPARRALGVNATAAPTTAGPTPAPTTALPSYAPTTARPTRRPTWSLAPTTALPTYQPTTPRPTTPQPSSTPTTAPPTTSQPTTSAPSYEPTPRPSPAPSPRPTTPNPTTPEPSLAPSYTRAPTVTLHPTLGPTPTPIIVACAGDSITQGGHEEDLVDGTAGHSYPELLQELLGPGYRVLNFGRSGTSLGPEKPWRTQGHFESMIEVKYDFAILTFGANDAKTDRCEACWGADWDSHADDWAKNYVDLISDLRDYNPTAKVFLGINTPYLGGSSKWGTEALTVINDVLPVSSAAVASVIGARGTVDFRSGFVLEDGTFDATLYDDKIHPNNAGYAKMAAAAYTAILNPNMLDVPAPSRAPTYAPTYTPSPGPTVSMVPTTSFPSSAPTTAKPSPAPTTSFNPTVAPSLSARPTSKPSAEPSSSPTTARPSASTPEPTLTPSTATPTTSKPTTSKPSMSPAPTVSLSTPQPTNSVTAGVVTMTQTVVGIDEEAALAHKSVFASTMATMANVAPERVTVAISTVERRRLTETLSVNYAVATPTLSAAEALARDMAALAPSDFDDALQKEAAKAGAAEAFASVETTSLSAPAAAPAPESEPSQKGDNGPDAASAAVLGPVIGGAFLIAVLGLGLLLRRRRRRKLSEAVDVDLDEDVEEATRIKIYQPPPPPPPLPPQTPGAGSPAGLVELDGLAPPPPPPPDDLPQSPKVTPSFWARTMTTVRNLRSNSQDDDDAAPSPVKQVESVTPAPPHGSPPVREASTASAGERLRLAISGWRGPPPADRVSFDEELRNFDDDFKEEAVADLFEAHLADTPVATRPPVDVVDVSPVGEEEDHDVAAQLE